MALTRDFRETVAARAARDHAFKAALLRKSRYRRSSRAKLRPASFSCATVSTPRSASARSVRRRASQKKSDANGGPSWEPYREQSFRDNRSASASNPCPSTCRGPLRLRAASFHSPNKKGGPKAAPSPRKKPRASRGSTRGSALVSDGTCTGPGRSLSSAAPSQSMDLFPL